MTSREKLARIRAGFAGFLSEGVPHFTIVIHNERDGNKSAQTVQTLDLERRTLFLDGSIDPAHVEGALRNLLPGLLSPALLVHAALLADGRRAWLCCGSSGSGKSTLARLFPSFALGEELAAVSPVEGYFRASALPMRTARRGTVPLTGVHILRHGKKNIRRRLPPAEALRALHRHVYWPLDDQAAFSAAFATLGELTERVPVWDLAFRPDSSAWTTISREA